MKLQKMMYVSMFATIMGVLGLIPPIFTGISPVPITLQTLGVMLSGNLLGSRFGPKYAAYSQLLFLGLVAIGLPLLSGGRGGFGAFFTPSGGYLIGYVVGAYVIGIFCYRMKNMSFIKLLLVTIFGGIFAVYLFGIPIQAFMMNISIMEAIVLSLVYFPGDFLKVIIATVLATRLQSTALFVRELKA